jgi:GH43 family beta-xylosidase
VPPSWSPLPRPAGEGPGEGEASESKEEAMQAFYHNPVYRRGFPDPFVLKHRGVYWAYCTGAWNDGRWFGILRSYDLSIWEEIGGAVEPIPAIGTCRWAPEVSYHNGRFYLYYSLGDEATMTLRVAVADHPAGPFIDTGRVLSEETFAIDAHIFVDDDGSRHLFYATDYLEHSHIGTGTARRRLADPLTPAEPSTPVTRARYDWQVYDPQRVEKGGVRWHTIEGPTVLKHKGQYYQMFSGGNWQNPSYGVSYAISPTLTNPDEWRQVADGEEVLPLLRTIPGVVIGPGHNSVVRGPNNRDLVCVYHLWATDGSERIMAIDRLDWAGERMILLGPSTTPQLLPLPTISDFFASEYTEGLGPLWECTGGNWRTAAGEALQEGEGTAKATLLYPATHYLVEVSVRAISTAGRYGVALGDEIHFTLDPAQGQAIGAVWTGDEWRETILPLPEDWSAEVYHLLRVEVNGPVVTMQLDKAAARWAVVRSKRGSLPVSLWSENGSGAFAGFSLSEGWEDWFEADELLGWEGGTGWQVREGALHTTGDGQPLRKGPLPEAYELTINGRLEEASGWWAFYPAAQGASLGPRVVVEQDASGWWVRCYENEQTSLTAALEGFDPTRFEQLRAVVAEGKLSLRWENLELGSVPLTDKGEELALAAYGSASFDLIRVTALTESGNIIP